MTATPAVGITCSLQVFPAEVPDLNEAEKSHPYSVLSKFLDQENSSCLIPLSWGWFGMQWQQTS